MSITIEQKTELLSYKEGKPFIITQRDGSCGNDIFSILAFVRTVSTPVPVYTDSVSMTLTIPTSFPTEAPMIRLTQGKLFHPNFTDDGFWIGSGLENNESVYEYLMRLVRTLQYKEIDRKKIANRNAMAWYNANKETNIFPTDTFNYSVSPRISIQRINEGYHQERSQQIQIGEIHYE